MQIHVGVSAAARTAPHHLDNDASAAAAATRAAHVGAGAGGAAGGGGSSVTPGCAGAESPGVREKFSGSCPRAPLVRGADDSAAAVSLCTVQFSAGERLKQERWTQGARGGGGWGRRWNAGIQARCSR
jgi:hypothetical protein